MPSRPVTSFLARTARGWPYQGPGELAATARLEAANQDDGLRVLAIWQSR